jgi:hypothetical protein
MITLAFEAFLFTLRSDFACRKVLRNGAVWFNSPPKEGVLLVYVSLKNPSSRPGLNTRTLDLVIRSLTATPPKRLT